MRYVTMKKIARRNPIPEEPNLIIDGNAVGKRTVRIDREGNYIIKSDGTISRSGDGIRKDMFDLDHLETWGWRVRSLSYNPWDLLVFANNEWRFRREFDLDPGINVIGFLKTNENLSDSNQPRRRFVLLLRPSNTVEIFKLGR